MPLTTNLASDPRTLLGLVRHHARGVEAIVQEILSYITLYCGSDSRDWILTQSRKAGNSFWLTDSVRQFHFRYDHAQPTVILIKDHYYNGRVIQTITSRVQAEKFLASITAHAPAPALVNVP